MSTDEDKETLIPYDHTKLSNINTCPTWGILRYSLHKTMGGHGREMALEAGAAAHEAFAAMNWWYSCKQDIDEELRWDEGVRIFGADRLASMLEVESNTATDRTNVINFALEGLYTSGFYDDPSDRNRTVSNISEGIIAWIDRYDPNKYKFWHSDNTIGIECVFDIVATIEYKTTVLNAQGVTRSKDIRLTGKMDALKYNLKHNRLETHEYKTGYRIDDSWLAQWIMSHQITGYCVAAGTFTNEDCNHAQVSGMKIPIGKNPEEGVKVEDVPRNTFKYEKWAEWLVHTVALEEQYRDNILDAPRYTHSCNRYFRSCSFLPLCDANTREEAEEVLDMMSDDEWSPLHE
jgi:hypothetical protein